MAAPVSAADRLLARKERILSRWLERVRSQIAEAANLSEPVLVDTLPAVLRQLAEALSPDHPRSIATEGSTVAQEHGSERVRVTHFRLTDVLIEYRLLRDVIFEELEEEAPLTPGERATLRASVDEMMMKACTAYVLVQEGFREQFFATLAHDLRNPLVAARITAELVLRRPADANVPRWAARTLESLERADQMLQDLLDAMRLDAGNRLPLELEKCDLVDLVRESVARLEVEHGQRFVLTAPEPVVGWFAPEPLRRACVNLGNNAVKYGASGRPITFTVRQNHGRAFVWVHNHGEPIPVDQQETIFRTFQRAARGELSGKKGWGLGLAQVRGVAEAHGGSIGVDSLPEKGTTFTIDIPIDSRSLQPVRTTLGSP